MSRPRRCARSSNLAIKTARSPAEVAAFSDLVIVVVGFDTEIDTALFGPNGVMQGAKPGLVIAIASTVAPGCHA